MVPLSFQRKILYFALAELELPGGPTVHVMNLLKGFKALQADVLLIAPRPLQPLRKSVPAKTHFVRFFGFSFWRLQLFYFFSFFALLYERFHFKADYVMIRESENSAFIALAVVLLGHPVLIEVNGPIRGNRWNRKILFNAARALVFNSEGLRKQILQEYSIPEKKAFVVSMHVDTDCFKPLPKEDCRKKLGFTPMQRILGYVGTFQPTHEIYVLIEMIEVFRRKSKIEQEIPHLVLVGGGNRQAFWKAEVGKLGLEKWIHFTGWVPHPEIPFYVNAFDLGIALLKPEKVYATEAFLKIKEYMACGIPVMVNECSPELFKGYPENTIHFVPTDNPEHLMQKVQSLFLDSSGAVLEEAVTFVRRKFGVQEAAEMIDQFMKSRI